MSKVLRCDCGLSILLVSEEDLVTEARRHATEVHDIDFTPDEILALVRPLDGAADEPSRADQ